MAQSRSENLGLLLKPVGHVQVQRTVGALVEKVDELAAGSGGGGTSYGDSDVSSYLDELLVGVDEIILADATDEETAIALANANKAAINAILSALKGS